MALAIPHAFAGSVEVAWPLAVLTCETRPADRLLLRMVLVNAGQAFSSDGAARIEFASSGPDGPAQAAPAPGLRTMVAPVRCRSWAADHIAVVDFGPFAVDDAMPASLWVRGGLEGGPVSTLGRLVRGAGGDASPAFHRVLPWSSLSDGEHRLLVIAAGDRVDDRRFLLKIAYFNAGETFDKDYSAFVHFELGAKGEDLDQTAALGLQPMSRGLDTAGWREDELTVVTFGPIAVPSKAPEHVYVRAGLYDQFGTHKRLALPGSDDATGRVLVGRFVTTGARTTFERLPLLRPR